MTNDKVYPPSAAPEATRVQRTNDKKNSITKARKMENTKKGKSVYETLFFRVFVLSSFRVFVMSF